MCTVKCVLYLKAQQYKAAVQHYSSALTKCQLSRSFSLAAANRSLALVRLGKHKEALEDISLALEAGGYPEENRHKLLERRAKCHLHLGQYREAEQCLESGLAILASPEDCDKERMKARKAFDMELKKVRSGEE